MLKIIGFPFCNVESVRRYFVIRQIEHEVTLDPKSISKDDVIVLPGVGTFKQGMTALSQYGLIDLLRNHCKSEGALIGICLGMQLLFEGSEEDSDSEGLSILEGECKRLESSPSFKVPHIGWNGLHIGQSGKNRGRIDKFESDVYFVHSYYCVPRDESIIRHTFSHPSLGEVCASVKKGRIIGCQFHPEKSGNDGYALLDSILQERSCPDEPCEKVLDTDYCNAE